MNNEDAGNVVFKKEEWDYITPMFPDGEHTFNGLPCPTVKAFKHFGESGIDEIDKRIKEMIQWKQELYGMDSDRLGFDLVQLFKNKVGETIFLDGQILTSDPELYAFPDRINSKNYVIDYSKSVISKGVNDIIE